MADPYVIKTGPAAVFGGELVTYTLVYGNGGNAPADVEITDTLPVSFTTAAIAYDNSGLTAIDDTNTRSWTATLAAGDRFTFTLALTVPTAIANNTRITNTVDIATEAAGNVAANDRATASSTVYQIVPIATARAGITGEVFGIEGSVIYVPGTLGTNEWGMQDASGGISMFFSPRARGRPRRSHARRRDARCFQRPAAAGHAALLLCQSRLWPASDAQALHHRASRFRLDRRLAGRHHRHGLQSAGVLQARPIINSISMTVPAQP